MQLDAVEAGLARPPRGAGEQVGQYLRRSQCAAGACRSRVRVRPSAVLRVRVHRARREALLREAEQCLPNRLLRGTVEPERRAMPIANAQVLAEFRRVGATPKIDGKSISWMNSFVSPPLACLTASTMRRNPGTNRSCPIRSSGPLGTSRMPVASSTMAPGRPCGEARSQRCRR
ncbi:MAG: hypothetical protein U1F17_11135 [Burkholderiaceae bacterium]